MPKANTEISLENIMRKEITNEDRTMINIKGDQITSSLVTFSSS